MRTKFFWGGGLYAGVSGYSINKRREKARVESCFSTLRVSKGILLVPRFGKRLQIKQRKTFSWINFSRDTAVPKQAITILLKLH